MTHSSSSKSPTLKKHEHALKSCNDGHPNGMDSSQKAEPLQHKLAGIEQENSPQNTPPLAPDMLKEINRLHAVAQQQIKQSRRALNGSLSAAWHAGHLLRKAKIAIRRNAGRGAWMTWLRLYFNGGVRTAQRYMQLIRSVRDPACLAGMSLRQAYFRLGVATEPKSAAALTNARKQARGAAQLTAHIALANKLARVLRLKHQSICVQDLAPLYRQLRALFEREERA
jgi:hypothetical protein